MLGYRIYDYSFQLLFYVKVSEALYGERISFVQAVGQLSYESIG